MLLMVHFLLEEEDMPSERSGQNPLSIEKSRPSQRGWCITFSPPRRELLAFLIPEVFLFRKVFPLAKWMFAF